MRKKIVVIGGSGFIGKNLLRFLSSENYEVFNLDIINNIKNSDIKYYYVDILDIKIIKKIFIKIKPNVIFNLAAKTDLDGKELKDYSVNFEGTSNICKAINFCFSEEAKPLYLHFSSMLIHKYGDLSFSKPSPETNYGKSKLISEQIVFSELNHKCNFYILRPTSIWGPEFKEPYSKFFKYVLSRKFLSIRNFENFRTFGYIDNSCYQIIQIMKKNYCQEEIIFYIGDYLPLDIYFFARRISHLAGIKKPLTVNKSLIQIISRIFQIVENIFPFLKNKLPLNNRRYRNMITPWVMNLNNTKKIAPNLPKNIDEAIFDTISWININK